MPASAQQQFAAFLRDRVAPALRERGLKGSGQVFRLPDDERFLQIGFQRSVHANADEVMFTINLQAVKRDAWDALRRERPWLPEKPSPNTRYGPAVWHLRAGFATAERRDVWWTLHRDTDLDGLAAELLAAFDEWLLPALNAGPADGGPDTSNTLPVQPT